jgi:hypothetical protein
MYSLHRCAVRLTRNPQVCDRLRMLSPAVARVTRTDLVLAFLIAAATFAVYTQVQSYDFVAFDDPVYVTANEQVRAGLTGAGVRWAFTTTHDGNWFPLTWLSHMADVDLYGLQPGRHHLTNVILHAASTLLLFLALRRMTRSRWAAAFVASMFGLHPLHVESVAWVAERKDVLSGLFWMLTFAGYAFYVERPGWRRYLWVILPFTLGLLSKTMIVTLPFVLLLFDVWPLGRLRLRTARRWQHSARQPQKSVDAASRARRTSAAQPRPSRTGVPPPPTARPLLRQQSCSRNCRCLRSRLSHRPSLGSHSAVLEPWPTCPLTCASPTPLSLTLPTSGLSSGQQVSPSSIPFPTRFHGGKRVWRPHSSPLFLSLCGEP